MDFLSIYGNLPVRIYISLSIYIINLSIYIYIILNAENLRSQIAKVDNVWGAIASFGCLYVKSEAHDET